MTWQREQKQARRARRGIRRSSIFNGRVIPPSIGRCYLVLEEGHLARLPEVLEFIHARAGRIVAKDDDRPNGEKRLISKAARLGYMRCRDQFLVEIDDNDLYLIEFALMFD